MYPVLLLLPCFYALLISAVAFVPGLVCLALASATKPRPIGPKREEEAPGCGAALHGVFLSLGVLLLSVSCGLVGAGLASVVLNLVLAMIALISYSVSPTADVDIDPGTFSTLYLGVLFVAFLGFLFLGMDRLGRWLRPKDA